MKVRIQNFQSIKDITFEIEGFTVIVGETSIGKSAILRALYYPLHSVSEKGFVRLGEKSATVSIWDDDFSMVWEKGESGTRIHLNGDVVPDSKILRGHPLQGVLDAGYSNLVLRDGKKKISAQFASQYHGNTFLFDETPQTIAEVLAQLSRLDVLMKAEKGTSSDVRKINSRLNVREKDVVRLQGKVDSYSGLEDILPKVEEVQLLDRGITESKELVYRVEGIQTEMSASSQLALVLEDVPGSEVLVIPGGEELSLFKESVEISLRVTSIGSILRGLDALEGIGMAPLPPVEEYLPLVDISNSLGSLHKVTAMELPLSPATPELDEWERASRLHSSLLTVGRVMEGEIPKVPIPPDAVSVSILSKAEEYLALIREAGKGSVRAGEEKDAAEGELAVISSSLAELERQLGTCPLCGVSFEG